MYYRPSTRTYVTTPLAPPRLPPQATCNAVVAASSSGGENYGPEMKAAFSAEQPGCQLCEHQSNSGCQFVGQSCGVFLFTNQNSASAFQGPYETCAHTDYSGTDDGGTDDGGGGGGGGGGTDDGGGGGGGR